MFCVSSSVSADSIAVLLFYFTYKPGNDLICAARDRRSERRASPRRFSLRQLLPQFRKEIQRSAPHVHNLKSFDFVFPRYIFHSLTFQSLKICPSTDTITTCHGMNFPLRCNAFFVACSSPPQQGTSIRTITTLFTSFAVRISVSFSL